MATLERAGQSDMLLFAQHLARYHFALGLAEGSDLLDLGCGEGFGSQMLRTKARSVASLDIAVEAVTATQAKGSSSVIRADARQIPIRDGSFDLVVSFEVFEHITAVERYIAEAFRVLKQGGRFLVSTPNVECYPMAGMNPFHVKEYTVPEVTELLLAGGFKLEKCFAQETNNAEVARLEKSPLLLTVMKLKRRLGFHGDLLPAFLQRQVKRAIAGGDIPPFDPKDYLFIEGKINSPELMYLAVK